jgi:hypothetical protein
MNPRLCSSVLILFLPISSPADPFDHVAAIVGLDDEDKQAGSQLYTVHCAACHGKDGNLTLNPLARRFAKDELKFGSDPYSLWETTSYGNGLMFRWDAVLSDEQRYQIVHYIREAIIKPSNPEQYFDPDSDYFEGLNARAEAVAKDKASVGSKVPVAPGMIDGTGGRNMIYGPFLQHAVTYSFPEDINAERFRQTTEKALIVGLPNGGAVCYDIERMSVSGYWKGTIANTEDTHHTSYKGQRPLMPGGELLYTSPDSIGWTGGKVQFNGHYLHGDRVALSFSVGDREVVEITSHHLGFRRALMVGPGRDPLQCRISVPTFGLLSPNGSLVRDSVGNRWVKIPPSEEPMTFLLGNDGISVPVMVQEGIFEEFKQGGPRRWPQIVQTAVDPGESIEGYAADHLTVPLANPWGSWMRTSAFDFFSDGRMAVSTLSGDVWIVSFESDNPNALNWSRFATGLYEPLGLKIVDEKVYVRGRDRITRLHDINGNGEADFYESFYETPGLIGASYHAFIYDLQTDQQGNFYFSQSGYKSPLDGGVIRLSPDGKKADFVCHDLRNPNGIGLGGPHDWLTVADNPSGVAIYNGFSLVRGGESFGFQHPRTAPMLAILPVLEDSSSGGQCWSDPERWGPLSGAMIHTAYSLCRGFYVITENCSPHPNGFASRLPFEFESGAMRPRVNPIDGQVYILCHKGWDSNAQVDGIIYRIRHTGEPCHLVKNAATTGRGLRFTFACELDPGSVTIENVTATRESDKKGSAPVEQAIESVELVQADTIEIIIPGIENESVERRTHTDEKTGVVSVSIHPAISVNMQLKAADGSDINQTVHATVNSLPR